MKMEPDSEIVVKVSLEDAGAISFTRVLEQRVTVRDLVLQIVAVTGKDAIRVRGVLERGSFVKGLSRLRWKSFEAEAVTEACLSSLPDPMPERVFHLQEASHVRVAGRQAEAVLELASMKQRRWIRPTSAYAALEAFLEREPPAYLRYDYEARCDLFLREPNDADRAELDACWDLLVNREQRRQLRGQRVERLVFQLPR